MLVDAMTAVSYTHLDVYKRQVSKRANNVHVIFNGTF